MVLKKTDGDSSSEGFLFDSDVQDIAYGIEGQNAVLTGLAVSESNPVALTVDVAAGTTVANDTLRTLAATTVAITTADGTFNRNDIVCVNTSGVIVSSVTDSNLKGVEDADESVPDTPAGFTRLAVVFVASGATTIADAAISDARILNDPLGFMYGVIAMKGDVLFDATSDTAIKMGATTMMTFENDASAVTMGTDLNMNGNGIYPMVWEKGADLVLDTDGAITVTHSFHRIDTFEAGATDDCVNILGGIEGQTLMLRGTSNGRDITFKNGTGNIDCGSDRAFVQVIDTILLMFAASRWRLLAFNVN